MKLKLTYAYHCYENPIQPPDPYAIDTICSTLDKAKNLFINNKDGDWKRRTDFKNSTFIWISPIYRYSIKRIPVISFIYKGITYNIPFTVIPQRVII